MGESLTDFSDYLSRVSASSLNYFEPLGSHEPNDLDHLPTQETQSPQISESGVSLVPEPLRDLVAIEVATFVPYLEVRFGRITYRSPSSGLCFSGLNNNSVIQTHPAEGVSSGCIDPLQTLFSVDGALDMIPYHKAKVSFANEHIPGFTSLISEDANVIQNVISYPPVACYFRDEQVIHPDPQGFAVDTTQEFILKRVGSSQKPLIKKKEGNGFITNFDHYTLDQKPAFRVNTSLQATPVERILSMTYRM